jgi:hypothetical protein
MALHPQRPTDFWSWRYNIESLKVFLLWFGTVNAIGCVFVAWDEKRPIGGFAEEVFARFCFWTMLLGSLWLGGWFGALAYEKTANKLIGWIVGVVLIMAFAFVTDYAASSIPGVDWRFKRLSETNEYSE